MARALSFLPMANAINSPGLFPHSSPKTRASLPGLPLELIQKIYHEIPDIKSVVNLSETSRRFRAAFVGSQKLLIIENVLEHQFGPLHEAIQVVTLNESQPAHAPRRPAISMALAQQVVHVGYVAQKWEALYPLLRWRTQTDHRRTLRPHESYRLRRALYRLWLYSKAFHSSTFLGLNRSIPRSWSKDRRLTFMRRFDDDEILEITELNDVFHEMVHNDLCPSNAIIQQRFAQGFPGQAPLYFGSYETYPAHCGPDPPQGKVFFKRDLPHDLVSEAWGTWELQEGVVCDILKLEPDKLLNFREMTNRAERVNYLNEVSEPFRHQPSTLRFTVDAVMDERNYWTSPNHGIDGGILDFLDEIPGGRYKQSGCLQDFSDNLEALENGEESDDAEM